MQIWLGPELGHQPLQGFTFSDPKVIAMNFLNQFNLPMTELDELEDIIKMKIQEYNSIGC